MRLIELCFSQDRLSFVLATNMPQVLLVQRNKIFLMSIMFWQNVGLKSHLGTQTQYFVSYCPKQLSSPIIIQFQTSSQDLSSLSTLYASVYIKQAFTKYLQLKNIDSDHFRVPANSFFTSHYFIPKSMLHIRITKFNYIYYQYVNINYLLLYIRYKTLIICNYFSIHKISMDYAKYQVTSIKIQCLKLLKGFCH